MDTDCSEYEDDDSNPIDDNFHVGVATDAKSAQEKSSSLVENQIKNILQRESYLVIHSTNKLQTFLINNIIHFKILECRELVSTVKYSSVFRSAATEIYFFGIYWNYLINLHTFWNKSHIISEDERLVRVRRKA